MCFSLRRFFQKSDSPTATPIPGIQGVQFPRGTQAYENNKYQYASSSHGVDHDMNPGLIIQAQDKNDIIQALRYAKAQKIAVAIRTGGHQYSGASSTSAPNILLDLKRTFRGPDDQKIFTKDGKTFIRTSISWSLGALNTLLTKNGLFMPHGQCTDVHLGGHVQTGGYGQLIRSFGLFGDHVVSIELIDYNGNVNEITRTSDSELFFAILGGSPGNLGVITHVTLQVHRDSDHEGSRGLKALYWYSPETLERLVNIVVDMSRDEEFLANYDLCVSVLSSSFKLLDIWPELDGVMRRDHPEIYGESGVPFWPRTLIVYAQWVPLSPDDKFDASWFDRLREESIFDQGVMEKPMSQLTGEWLFRNPREFDHPYDKRAILTNSPTLKEDGWASWVTKRIDAIVQPDDNGLWISAQVQCLGGKYSKFRTNANNGTSYSWRDSNLICILDCFYSSDAKKRAEDWQKVNDTEGLGPKGLFCKQERRMLWGSYGSFDLDQSWKYYFEDKAKYERLQAARKKADPNGIFTPNTFCVKHLA